MTINQAGIDLIKSFEKCRLKAYKPLPSDPWTIGWGSTGGDIVEGLEWTQEQADARFAADLEKFSSGVKDLVTSLLDENQFAALVSFAYNCGLDNLRRSTLLRCVNKNNMKDAANEFGKWTKSAGVVVQGLVNRRAAERELFLTP